jgi:hypothetical protein
MNGLLAMWVGKNPRGREAQGRLAGQAVVMRKKVFSKPRSHS